jgi:hypothetical protein
MPGGEDAYQWCLPVLRVAAGSVDWSGVAGQQASARPEGFTEAGGMIRDHAYHGDHQDERTRLKTRRREIERERRRLGSLVQAEHEYVNGYGQRVENEDVLVEGREW